jgi:hypothetical protein
MAGAAGIALGAFSTLPFIVAVIVSVPIAALGLALAFYTFNGRPFITVLEHAFNYTVHSKLYLWNADRPKDAGTKKTAPTVVREALVPKLSESKLRDLSWSLNIKDRALMGVQDGGEALPPAHEGVDLDSIKL